VALVKQKVNESSPSCAGAGAAPLASFNGNASKVEVVGSTAFGYGVLPTSAANGVPLVAGTYTICTCNAEKANDPKYSNCNTDCSYHLQNGTFTIVDTPRVGPLADPGNARIVSNVSTTFRITAGLQPDTALVQGDKVYVAPTCEHGPALVPEANRSQTLSLLMPSGGFSTFVKLPTMLTSSILQLKWCFTTIEMGATPAVTEYAELPDSLTVIRKPRLAGSLLHANPKPNPLFPNIPLNPPTLSNFRRRHGFGHHRHIP